MNVWEDFTYCFFSHILNIFNRGKEFSENLTRQRFILQASKMQHTAENSHDKIVCGCTNN